MKNLLTAAAAAAAAVTLTATSAWAGTINQGDRVRNQEWMTCTVGYVQDGSAYTAGHCGKTGDTMFNFQTNEQIGTLDSHFSYAGGEDWAEITLNDTTDAGENIYSGNQVVSPEDIEVGDTIHSYGGKTGQQYTGTVTRTDGHQVLATGEAGGLPGDSGGPAWIDGKGLVGVYSSYYTDGAPEDKYAVGFHPVAPEGAPRYEAAPEDVPEENPAPAPDADQGDAEAESGDINPAPEESPETDKPETNKPETEKVEPKPESDKPETDKPETDKPETDKPETDKPETDKPESDKPETDKPESDKPETDKPETDKPESDKPETDKPEPKPESDKPETEKVEPKPESDKPETDKPETDKPETDKPETDKPESDKPETEKVEPKPETDKPESDKPETDKPEAEGDTKDDVHYEEAPLGSEDAYIEVNDFNDTAFHGARGEVETTESDATSENTSDNEAENLVDNSAENTSENAADTVPEDAANDTRDTAASDQDNESRTLASTGVGNWVVPVSILAVVLIIAGGVAVFRSRKK